MNRPGKNAIVLSGEDWLKGHGSSVDLTDGTFRYNEVKESVSDDSISAVNVWTDPGVLYPQPPSSEIYSYTTSDSDPRKTFIATCKGDFDIGATNFFVTNTGQIYSDYGSGLTLVATDVTANRTYLEGMTNMVIMNYNLYISSGGTNAEVIKIELNSYDGTYVSADYEWLTTTKGVAYQHSPQQPLLVYENNLWIGNMNVINRYNPITDTASYGTLSLNTDNIVTALGIDNNSGKMMIGVSLGYNGSGTRANQNKILIWDGINLKPTRAVNVEDIVTAIYNLAGVNYMLYGDNRLGYWNGSGITLLRKLRANRGISFGLSSRFISQWQGNLLVVDGNRILMYGSISNRPKAWYCIYVYRGNTPNNGGLRTITLITTKDTDNLFIATERFTNSSQYNTKMEILPMSLNKVSGFYADRGYAGELFFNKIDFGDKLVQIKGVKIFTKKPVANPIYSVTVAAFPSSGPSWAYTYDVGEYMSFSATELYGNPSSTNTFMFYPTGSGDPVFDEFFLYIQSSTYKLAITKIIIYYDIIE